MSNYEIKPGDGSLFANERQRSDKDPALRGYLVLPDNTVVAVAAWKRTTRDGKEIISLKVDERDTAYQAKQLKREPFGGAAAGGEQTPHRRVAMETGSARERGGFGSGGEQRSATDEIDFDDEIPF